MTFNTHVCIIISSIPSNTIDYVRINEKKKTMRFNTSLLHAGVTKETNGSTLPPVYQTSAFEQESAADLEKIFENKAPGYCYTRVANPTITAFENRITKLEGGIASVACASGMAALMNTFLNILSSGDELISSASLYGGTIDLFHDLEAFGITTRYVENNNWQQIEDSINEHTRLIFAETIGNPCLDVTDIEKLAEIAHAHDIPLVVDNTTSTAYLIQVLKHGADIVVNSSSKYINGSSNAISGILTDSGKFKWDKNRYPGFADYVKYGPMAFVAKLRNSLFRNMGACLAPVNAYLNIIGLETLGLRMERECSNALELASWIENKYPDIKVNYPGLCSSKWHEIAKKQLTNGYGAILTIRVGSKEKAFKFIDSLTIPYTLSNIGDTKTLVIHPGSTISLHSTDKQKEDAGVFEDLIRVSVGIEDIDDLKEVNYPGLCSSKWHEIAKKQLTNGYGAILTIRVGSKEKAFKFIDSLTIPYTLSNIGDTKTLVIHPGSTISLHSTDKQKEDAGVFEDLIRVSVGIEDIDDLKEDFAQAFLNIAD